MQTKKKKKTEFVAGSVQRLPPTHYGVEPSGHKLQVPLPLPISNGLLFSAVLYTHSNPLDAL